MNITDDRFNRGSQGKFAPKSADPRKVRSINVTDYTWQWLDKEAKKHGQTRNDFLESLSLGEHPFMETDKPFMETDKLKAENQLLQEHKGELEAEVANLQDEIRTLKSQFQEQPLKRAVNPFDLLNDLKGQRKKSKATVDDIEAILEILENG